MIIVRIITFLLFNTTSISYWRALTLGCIRVLLLIWRRVIWAFNCEKCWLLLRRRFMSLQAISSLVPASLCRLPQILILTPQRSIFSHHKLRITRHHVFIFSNDYRFPLCINTLSLTATYWHHHHLLMTTHHHRGLIDRAITAVCRAQAFLQTSSFFWTTLDIFIVFFIIYLAFFLRICWPLLMLKCFKMSRIWSWMRTCS